MGDEAKKRLEFEKEFNKIDPHASWIYQPHTVTFFLVVVGIATYFAFNQENVSFESNVKYGLSAVGIIFLLFSSVQMKDGLFYRPHPVVWRTVMGAGVLYLCTLVFFLFQNVEDARGLLNKFDSRLGTPLPERSYADHCDLYTPHDPSGNKFKNLWDTVNDEFIIAHLFGWLGKALFLRDVYLCWFMSILFEILEVTFEHMLPNFKECWWDHIILDILVCNWLGFTIGLKIVEYFQMKRYNFIAPNVEAYHWQVLTDWKRLVYVVGLMIVISVVELNAFFLKFVLYVPPPHPINVIRLILWWSIGLPAVREYYYYVIDKRCKKFGPMAWLAVAIMTLELLICIKFGKGMFSTPHPDIVVYSWLAFVAAFVLWAVVYYGFFVGKSAENNFPVQKGSARPAFIEKNDVAISNKSNGKVKNRKQKGNQ